MAAFSSRSFLRGFHFLLALVVALSGPAFFHWNSTILDTLGAATPTTRFALAGSGGQGLSSGQQVGPMFVLTRPTLITEIGGFVAYCELLYGVTECPVYHPIVVQIHPALNGQPDLSRVLGTFLVSNHHTQVNSYEAAHMLLLLKPGSYFAMFRILGDGSAGMLSSASDPFAYQADSTTVGFIFSPEGRTSTGQLSLAVRILGLPLLGRLGQ